MTEDRPSARTVLRQLRNRVIEDLETAASYDQQREYQATVPFVNVVSEIICMWANDHVPDGWRSWFAPPVFTLEEIEAVAQFDEVLRAVSSSLPRTTPHLLELIGTEPWEKLRSAAQHSLAVFERRGRLSVDADETVE